MKFLFPQWIVTIFNLDWYSHYKLGVLSVHEYLLCFALIRWVASQVPFFFFFCNEPICLAHDSQKNETMEVPQNRRCYFELWSSSPLAHLYRWKEENTCWVGLLGNIVLDYDPWICFHNQLVGRNVWQSLTVWIQTPITSWAGLHQSLVEQVLHQSLVSKS